MVDEALDGFANLMKLSELVQLAAEPVSQGAFGTQLIDQGFGLRKGVGRDLGFHEQFSPTSRDFLFGEQISTLPRSLRHGSCRTLYSKG